MSGAKGKGVTLCSKIRQFKNLSTSEEKLSLSLFLYVISCSWSSHHTGSFLNRPVPWPHGGCSGTMSKPSHYIEPRHQFQGWVTGASPLRDLSLPCEDGPSHLCHLTTPHGISALFQRIVVRTIQTPLSKAKSLVSLFVPVWYIGTWSVSHYSCKIRNSQR